MHTSSSDKVIFVVPTKVGTQGLQSLAPLFKPGAGSASPRARGRRVCAFGGYSDSRVRGDDEFVRWEDIPAASFTTNRCGNKMCACPSAKADAQACAGLTCSTLIFAAPFWVRHQDRHLLRARHPLLHLRAASVDVRAGHRRVIRRDRGWSISRCSGSAAAKRETVAGEHLVEFGDCGARALGV
jgi:hypothetical protein